MSIIEVNNLTKYYGDSKALNDISLSLDENKFYGLLGRNAAGKTTLINIITNKIFASSGEVLVCGESSYENDKVLSDIFYMMERTLYPEGLRISEIFKWTKKFYSDFDMEYANNLAAKFELDTKKKVKQLSTGYTSIFKLIVAMASRAKILIFDEPVLGLDANHREMFYRELIALYEEKPCTIIISTHLIDEIAEVIEEVIIIKKGELLLKKSVEDLLESAYTVSGEDEKVDAYVKNRNVISVETMGRFKSVTITDDNKDKKLADELSIDIGKVDLQKLFIQLTKS